MLCSYGATHSTAWFRQAIPGGLCRPAGTKRLRRTTRCGAAIDFLTECFERSEVNKFSVTRPARFGDVSDVGFDPARHALGHVDDENFLAICAIATNLVSSEGDLFAVGRPLRASHVTLEVGESQQIVAICVAYPNLATASAA